MKTALATLVATGLLIACGADRSDTPVPQTASAPTTVQYAADKQVVDRIAGARCDQEQKCQNVGPGAKFDSRDICVAQVRGSIGNELNAYKCPRGLDRRAVDECMNAIRNENCEHPFDTLNRIDKCRTSPICMD